MSEEQNYLKVYSNKSQYITSNSTETFIEGKTNDVTIERMRLLKKSLSDGFLEEIFKELNAQQIDFTILDHSIRSDIDILINSITSEVGRALVGLTIMQMTIKAISSEQNIRLHKGSTNSSTFSWVDGVSMRTLDKNFVTPFLRKYNLLKLNADGFMMTRSLAENYPYTKLYKAQLKGAKEQWLNIIDSLESNSVNAKLILQYTLTLLQNKAIDFENTANEMLKKVQLYFEEDRNYENVFTLISKHIDSSDYAARLLEVSMHSLMQVIKALDIFPTYELKALSQMRSANKKHGNIGDIELLEDGEIVVSWDAKYGKNYLRDELDEISEKLVHHDKVGFIGFVITDIPIRSKEIEEKICDIKEQHGLEIHIYTFKEWVDHYLEKVTASGIESSKRFAQLWLTAYAESLAQKRRHIAPIDEPCFMWVESLSSELS